MQFHQKYNMHFFGERHERKKQRHKYLLSHSSELVIATVIISTKAIVISAISHVVHFSTTTKARWTMTAKPAFNVNAALYT